MPGDGDTFAKFIVLELIDTFDSKASEDALIDEATRVLETAPLDFKSNRWSFLIF